MKILNLRQGSTEWMLARAGVCTASEADSLFTPKMEPRTGEGVKTYLYQKAAERVMGYIGETGGTFAMDQGSVLEKVALPWFEFRFGVTLQKVGFCISDDSKIGCSPDALIGESGGLEIKCPTAPMHCRYLLEQRVPPAYLAQLHFSMFVTGRPGWTFCSYSPHMPPLVVNLIRDDTIQKTIGETVAKFTAEVDAAEKRIRALMPQGGRD